MTSLQGWGFIMCCICFEELEPTECVVDKWGTKWDACPGQCALDAGIEEFDEPV